MVNDIREVYLRNLRSLITEIEAYFNEADIWKLAPGINNCAGNLALHLAGNLNFFIGTYLGNTGYVRDRDREFSDKNIPKANLLQVLENVYAMTDTTLSALNETQLNAPYPTDKFGAGKTTAYVLVYLLGHLTYHLGQINYHRRLLTQI